jgi:hypothetical protein
MHKSGELAQCTQRRRRDRKLAKYFSLNPEPVHYRDCGRRAKVGAHVAGRLLAATQAAQFYHPAARSSDVKRAFVSQLQEAGAGILEIKVCTGIELNHLPPGQNRVPISIRQANFLNFGKRPSKTLAKRNRKRAWWF